MADSSLVVEGRVKNRQSAKKDRERPRKVFLIFAAIGLVFLVSAAYFLWLGPLTNAPTQDAVELRRNGANLYRAKKYVRASKYFERYIDLKPRDWRARELLADIYWRIGDTGQAFNELKLADNLAGSKADRLYKLGLLAQLVDEDAEAVTYLLKSVQSRPKSMLFRVELAKAYVKTGQFDKAINEWQAAIALLPEKDIYSAVIFAELGDTFQSAGEKDKAKEAYRLGLEIEPANLYLKAQTAKIGD